MNRKFFTSAAAAVAALAVTATNSEAQATVTNWTTGYFNDADGYVQGGSLTDTPITAPPSEQFQTTDPYDGNTGTGDNSYVDFIPGTTYGGGAGSASGNNSVYFGGIYPDGPGIPNQAIYKNFTSVLSGDPTESVTFSIDFRLIAGSDGIYDNWSFDLRNAAGDVSLVSFFVDANSDPGFISIFGNGLGIGLYDNSGGPLINLTAVLQGNSWSAELAGITAQTNGLGDVIGFITNAPTAFGSGALVGGAAGDFESVYISWLLESGNPAVWGENYLVINTMGVTSEVIPEPGTWAMGALLLSGVAATIYRRRKAATAVES